MVEVLYIVAAYVGVSALILWALEALARRIGARRTAILLLGVVPGILGALTAYANRASLRWWEFVVYPLAGPIFVCAVILLGYVCVAPMAIPDMLGLVCTGIQRAMRAVRRIGGPREP